MEIHSGKKESAWKIVIYGTPGIGKSTLAAFAPKPLFLDLENGLDLISNQLEKKDILLSRSPKIDQWETAGEKNIGFLEALKFAAESDYKTIVIDTISALEQILTAKAVADYNLSSPKKIIVSLAEIPFNQGFDILSAQWSLVMKMLTRLQKGYDKNIILIGHSTIQRVEDPTTENYDRFSIDTHKKCLASIVNNCDAVLFARMEVMTRNKENSEKKRAFSTGERVLFCLEQPSFLAKNRFGLPEKMKMDQNIFGEMAK